MKDFRHLVPLVAVALAAVCGARLGYGDVPRPAASIGARSFDALPEAAAAARTGDVIRVLRDLDWGKSFLPTGAVVTVDLDGHRICQYFWLSSGGTIRGGEIVPHAGWAAASFYGDGALENLVVTNAPSDSALIGFGRDGVTVEIRGGTYATGALVSTTSETVPRYRLRIVGGRFAARMWYDARLARDANVRVSGGAWAYDPTRWLDAGCEVVATAGPDAAAYPYAVRRKTALPAPALTTAPWQQNVYTNRFTIFCETKEVVPGLSLQYGSGFDKSVAMTCVPGDTDGTTQHYIYKGRVNLDSGGGVIGSLVSYRIVAGDSVLKCPDGSDAAGSVWVWTATGDKPAIASSACHANYLGFRLVKESGTEAYDVTLETLLDEMCDADAATRLAALPWTGRLWSSYDRASVSTNDLTAWYANNDRSQFVRTETRSGRTECVMVDAKGPGALTRLWTANGYGTVYRFYVDGASEPVVCGVGTNLVGGHVLCPAPLADEVSSLQPPAHRAQDLYLPITFAQSLVVTAELKDIPPDDDPGRTLRFWYNAEVRTYAEGTRIEPFSSAVLARAQDAIAAASAALRAPSAPVTDETQSLNGALAAGASRSVTFMRTGGAIRSFSLKLADGDEPLRTVRVKITFDGETTVDAAVGQLFGAGYAATPYATVNGGVAADGTLTFRQVMPFASSCMVTLENTGRSSCSVVASSVAVGAYDWDDARSLHFGALGFEERSLPTRRGTAGYYDMTWVTLEGQGRLVGNTLMLDNSQSDQWWGEGDEKIYIDGEAFPSYFGTGTEDFFGYAWGHGKAFTAHPFLALPLAGEGLTGGRRLVTTVRTRRLDVVPFATSLKLDVEIWHWEDCKLDYAPATFWYARPGIKVTRRDGAGWRSCANAAGSCANEVLNSRLEDEQ